MGEKEGSKRVDHGIISRGVMMFILSNPQRPFKSALFDDLRIGDTFAYFHLGENLESMNDVDMEEILIKTPNTLSNEGSNRNAVLCISKDEVDLGCYYNIDNNAVVFPVDCVVSDIKNGAKEEYERRNKDV